MQIDLFYQRKNCYHERLFINLSFVVMAHAESSLLEQLSTNSLPYADPLVRLDWAALDMSRPWLPEEAISLVGLAEFSTLPESTRVRLSQLEFTGFIHAGIWLEGIFIERLSRNLRHTISSSELAYYLHEIREESGHSLMFLKLMETSGIQLPGAWRDRPKITDFLGRYTPLHSTLFWLAVTIGEEIPDRLNRYIRTHGGKHTNEAKQVDGLIHQMCTLHIIDEARHIAHARAALETSLSDTPGLKRRLLTPMLNLMICQFTRTFYLPSSAVYEMAGLTPGKKWRELARRNPARHAFILKCLNPTLNMLREHGFAVRDPII